MKKQFYATYAPDTDISFVMCETCNGEGVFSLEVVGWYFGEPNEELTADYIGNMKAICD